MSHADWETPVMETRDGDPIAWFPASNDGNLDEGWVVLLQEDDGTTSASLCTYYEPRT